MLTYGGLSPQRLDELLARIQNVRVGIVGDICLDVYWDIDMRQSELSRETPYFNRPVVAERFSPGAGGNVIMNAAALRPQRVYACGLTGHDWRGRELLRVLEEAGVDISHMVNSADTVTPAYCKPMLRGLAEEWREDPRLDFVRDKAPGAQEEQALLHALEALCAKVDILCVCDQFAQGCVTDRVRAAILALSAKGLAVIADSRSRIGLYPGCILKPNAYEACHAIGRPGLDETDLTLVADTLAVLSQTLKSPVCGTAGALGCLTLDGTGGEPIHIPACPVKPPIDFCGAGDSFLASLACSLAAGAALPEAGAMGCLASAVTIHKLHTTGTASAAEILAQHAKQEAKA